MTMIIMIMMKMIMMIIVIMITTVMKRVINGYDGVEEQDEDN